MLAVRKQCRAEGSVSSPRSTVQVYMRAHTLAHTHAHSLTHALPALLHLSAPTWPSCVCRGQGALSGRIGGQASSQFQKTALESGRGWSGKGYEQTGTEESTLHKWLSGGRAKARAALDRHLPRCLDTEHLHG